MHIGKKKGGNKFCGSRVSDISFFLHFLFEQSGIEIEICYNEGQINGNVHIRIIFKKNIFGKKEFF